MSSGDFFKRWRVRCSTPQSPKISGRAAFLIAGSVNALRMISGPIPTGSPMVTATIGSLDMNMRKLYRKSLLMIAADNLSSKQLRFI